MCISESSFPGREAAGSGGEHLGNDGAGGMGLVTGLAEGGRDVIEQENL